MYSSDNSPLDSDTASEMSDDSGSSSVSGDSFVYYGGYGRCYSCGEFKHFFKGFGLWAAGDGSFFLILSNKRILSSSPSKYFSFAKDLCFGYHCMLLICFAVNRNPLVCIYKCYITLFSFPSTIAGRRGHWANGCPY